MPSPRFVLLPPPNPPPAWPSGFPESFFFGSVDVRVVVLVAEDVVTVDVSVVFVPDVVVVDFVVEEAVCVVVVLVTVDVVDEVVSVVLVCDVVVEDVVTVVVVHSPPANEAELPSHPVQSRSTVAVASVSTYCPATHSVMGVHCRSLLPADGRRLSNSPEAHVVNDAQM